MPRAVTLGQVVPGATGPGAKERRFKHLPVGAARPKALGSGLEGKKKVDAPPRLGREVKKLAAAGNHASNAAGDGPIVESTVNTP